MMNSPFIRRQHPARSIPVQKPEQKSSPKVISVPVQFISSSQPESNVTKPLLSKTSPAVTIQKVFRSFLVRKCVTKIISIKTEVNEIERRINDDETVDLIRNDPKERLRINETLMSLLFKLDSIRGIDYGVRDLRKTVTKKAIALQEKVDSIAQSVVENRDSVNKLTESQFSTISIAESVENEEDVKDVVENCDSVNKLTESQFSAEHIENEGGVKDVVDNCDSVPNKVTESQFLTETIENEEVVKDVVENCDSVPDKVIESQFLTETIENEEAVKEVVENCDSVKFVECSKVLERLMDDNEKMMKLMTQMSERNEMHTRMINSLSRRIEQLEKGFMDDQLRKKKKTKTNCGLRRRDI